MSNGSVAALVIAASGVVAVLVVAVLGGVIRLVAQVGGMQASITQLRADMTGQQAEMDREHAEIYDTIRDGRQAANQRFLRVEGVMFGLTGREQPRREAGGSG